MAYDPAGGGGITDHGNLTGRNEADAHPVEAVTGLQACLDEKANAAALAAVALSGEYADLAGRPTIGSAAAQNTGAFDAAGTAADAVGVLSGSLSAVAFNGSYGSLNGVPGTFPPIIGAGGTQACAGNDARLSNARTPTQHSVTGAEHSFPGGTGTFLRADGQFAAPAGGSDPWTYLRLASDFTTTSNAAQNVTGLAFTPLANERYEFVARLMVRTATATVGPRPGLAWPTGMTDGIVFVQQTSSATANVFANGNITAAVLSPVGGVPTTTGSWPALIEGYAIAGATPSGTIRVQLASETNGTTVRIVAGSFLKYRTVP